MYDVPGSGWKVDFAYGRIGKPLNYSTKTPHTVSEYTAHRIVSMLRDEKESKGYEVVNVVQEADPAPATVTPPATASKASAPKKATKPEKVVDTKPKAIKVLKTHEAVRKVRGGFDLSFLEDDE